MAEQKIDVDMIQNIMGFIGFALAIVIGLMTWGYGNLAQYFDPIYAYYGMGIFIILFGAIEMLTVSKQLEGVFNIVAASDMILAGILLYMVYFYDVSFVHDYLLYGLAALSAIWAIVEWFTK